MIKDPSTEAEPFEIQAQLLKLLAHPGRLAILNILKDGEHCVCHMKAFLGYRQAYISQQLMILREGGLIQDRRDGWNIFYRISDSRIIDVLMTIEHMLPSKMSKQPMKPVICTCPKCSAKIGE